MTVRSTIIGISIMGTTLAAPFAWAETTVKQGTTASGQTCSVTVQHNADGSVAAAGGTSGGTGTVSSGAGSVSSSSSAGGTGVQIHAGNGSVSSSTSTSTGTGGGVGTSASTVTVNGCTISTTSP